MASSVLVMVAEITSSQSASRFSSHYKISARECLLFFAFGLDDWPVLIQNKEVRQKNRFNLLMSSSVFHLTGFQFCYNLFVFVA
jgi:hypothetical protein